MTTDYEPFLHVTEDGCIWWVLMDAIRLGAGYLPFRDDHKTLITELRAPNDLAQLNERTLIGAFNDARLKVERPITIDRDGFRYVEAEEFLTWLSQYIEQTQAMEITFPSAIERAVMRAKSKAAASIQQNAANQGEFESLSLALENWFDKDFEELPEAERQRVERDFFMKPWDNLSADQRRRVARDWDSRHDPAMAQHNEYWRQFFEHLLELKEKLEEWQGAATPTASDLAVKESRIKELEQEIERMETKQRLDRGDVLPASEYPDGDGERTLAHEFIAYPKALSILRERWQATPDELAAWIFRGPEAGGIAAYCNANELDPPPRFYFAYNLSEDYLSSLMGLWFLQSDIDQFVPTDRYITGIALIERWRKVPDILPDAFICAKIAESRLFDFHPTFGHTEATFSEGHVRFPPLSSGLFQISHVERIEVEDGLDVSLIPTNHDPIPFKKSADKIEEGAKCPLAGLIGRTENQSGSTNVKREARKLDTQARHNAWRKEYRRLKRSNQNMSDVWCSRQIAKMDISKGCSAETIRKIIGE
ncbi:MAG: hypothetical protein RBT36_05965 [Desulfobulbus sp.]|jgi:hypothetical protein|nr:hypothetical protein [Desulfobulbus sp.]